MKKTILYIPGMDCAAEEVLIRKKLSQISDIKSIKFNLIQEQITVFHELPDTVIIQSALKEMGMNPEEIDETNQNKSAKDHTFSEPLTYKIWILPIVSVVMAFLAEILTFFINPEVNELIGKSLAALAILLSGKESFIKGMRAIKTFTLNINFLMVIAVIGAILIGEWPEAAMVTSLFAIAEMIEKYALDRARNAIRSLIEITPDSATVQNEQGAWEKIEVSLVKINQIIWVKPGERIPLDGVIVSGNTSVNQAPITGESLPINKKTGDQVFAGSINEEGSFEFRVTTTQNNTTLSRIIRAIEQAQSEKAPTERFVDLFSRYYTPIMVVMAILVATVPYLLFGANFYPWLYKALVLLVIACPCALVISTPVTVVSGLAAAAKHGILIKGGTYLENGRKLKVIALDKTGTLTEGKPAVTDIVPLTDMEEKAIVQLAASLNSHSNHPIAKAITAHWLKYQDSKLLQVSDFESITGRGVTGIINGVRYYIGNHLLIEEKGICSPVVEQSLEQLEKHGKTTLILGNEKGAIAAFAVADELRDTSIEAIKSLHALGIATVMITGDNLATAETIGRKVGIDRVEANLLPENKLSKVTLLLKEYHFVGMIGDGVNDAPALAKASIGFAMGAAGTDTAIETADIALMEDNLNKVPFFIQLSRKTSRILTENISLSISVKLLFFILAILGKSTLWMAVFADMGASIIVVFNGLRLIKYK